MNTIRKFAQATADYTVGAAKATVNGVASAAKATAHGLADAAKATGSVAGSFSYEQYATAASLALSAGWLALQVAQMNRRTTAATPARRRKARA